MTEFRATLKLANGSVVTVERRASANETILAIDHGKEASTARLLPRDVSDLIALLQSAGALK